MGSIYFELAPWSSMRLCLQMEESFSDLRGWQVELMRQLCLVAYNCELYDAVGREGWLRTTVSLPQVQFDPDSCIFSEESAGCKVIRRIAEHYSTINTIDFETYWRELRKLHRELVARVEIRSNIIPREAYREKLNEVLRRQHHGSSPPRTFRREFYPIRVLADAVDESTSASEKTKEWRRNGGQCVLARHLRTSNIPHAAPKEGLREAKAGVKTVRTLKTGVVDVVSWSNGIYARKKYQALTLLENERDVALRVCHPHVIRPVGQTCDVDGKPCLLMELLEGHLYRFFVEQNDVARGENSPIQGTVEILDVLLQIARGLKSLHDVNVVHGDIKPLNIFFRHFEISEDVRHFLVKVADFDVAKIVVEPMDFEPSHGTSQYAAPEVLRWTRQNVRANPRFCDPEEPDVASLPYKLDIYSFGCVAYEVLTGNPVYGGNGGRKNLAKVANGTLTPNCSICPSAIDAKKRECIVWQNLKKTYPRGLMNCLESCWAFNPSERPTSSELCKVLENSKVEMQNRVSWNERKCEIWSFRILSLIAFICFFSSSYTNSDAEKFWSWFANLVVSTAAGALVGFEKFLNGLVNLAVNVAAVALIGFVCMCCHNYSSGKLKRD